MIHANQDPRVISGNGTIAVEFLEQMEELGVSLDAIIVSIGGGGMISGISTYLKTKSPGTLIIGAEAERACSAYKTLEKGVLVKNPANVQICSIADSIKSSLGSVTAPIVIEKVDCVFTVQEEEIEEAMMFMMERTKQVVEGGCAAAVAVAIGKKLYERYPEMKNVGVVLCGGNVDMVDLPWMKKLG